MYKTIFVKAHFKPVGRYKTIRVPTGEKKKVLGLEVDVKRTEKVWEQTGYSDREIDGERLQQDVQQAIEGLEMEGFDVISISTIVSGNYAYDHKWDSESGYGYGYGFSYTEGVLIVAKKMR